MSKVVVATVPPSDENEEYSDSEDDSKKKQPGRPKKGTSSSNTPVRDIYGLATEPMDDENIVEVIYQNHKNMKKILGLFKSYNACDITFKFNSDNFVIMAKDHSKKATSFVIFDAHRINRYYAESDVEVTIKRDPLEKAFRCLGKADYKIMFILKCDDYRSVFNLVIKNLSNDETSHYIIPVIQRSYDISEDDFDKNYILSFNLDSKTLKSRVTEMNTNKSQTFTILKTYDEPLQFTYQVPKKVDKISTFNNPKKIGLKSTLKPNDILSITILVPLLKPFSNTNLGDLITMNINRSGPICLTTDIDYIDSDDVIPSVTTSDVTPDTTTPGKSNKVKSGYAIHVKQYMDIKKM